MSGAALLAAVLVLSAYCALVALVVAWVLIYWFPAYPTNPVLQKVYDVVDRAAGPIMRPIRRLIPTVNLGGGLRRGPVAHTRPPGPLRRSGAAPWAYRRLRGPRDRENG